LSSVSLISSKSSPSSSSHDVTSSELDPSMVFSERFKLGNVYSDSESDTKTGKS
jgi:hypothetical protein